MARRKEETTPADKVRFLAIMGALVLCSPLFLYTFWPRSPGLDGPSRGYHAVCPPAQGQPLVVLAYDSRSHAPEKGPSYTDYYDRYLVFDPVDGHELHRESLGEHREAAPADCFATIGDHVWLWTKTDGYHVREARTARIVRSQAELIGDLANALAGVFYDATNQQLFVSTKDGRTHAIDAKFTRTPVSMRSATSTRIVPSAIRLPGARSLDARTDARTSKGTLAEEGKPRRVILVDGEPLAGTDWLEPAYVIHPPSGTLEFPGPPSLIVCESVEVGKPKRMVTRVGLDGRILWSYLRPDAPKSRGSNGCIFHATADGARLVTFTDPNGMIGIDVATGAEVFRRVL